MRRHIDAGYSVYCFTLVAIIIVRLLSRMSSLVKISIRCPNHFLPQSKLVLYIYFYFYTVFRGTYGKQITFHMLA